MAVTVDDSTISNVVVIIIIIIIIIIIYTLSQSKSFYSVVLPDEHVRCLWVLSVAGPTSWNSSQTQHMSSDSFRGNYLECGTICELLNTLSAL